MNFSTASVTVSLKRPPQSLDSLGEEVRLSDSEPTVAAQEAWDLIFAAPRRTKEKDVGRWRERSLSTNGEE